MPLPPHHDLSVKERARNREIASYLDAAAIPPAIGPPSSPPLLCRDANLTALVQLGTLRLDTSRSFLSLIDGEYQYIVAEATRTHSLTQNGRHGPGDALYLGVSKLELSWGVCPNTMLIFTDDTGNLAIRNGNVTADSTRYIIKDFRNDAHYRECPYVKGFPHMVSYAEVPLVSPLGYVLGSYCVVDSKPRDFDNDETIAILSEISQSIMAHLDLRRMEQNRARSEKLIKGLGVFMGRTGATAEKEEAEREARRQEELNAAGALPPPSTVDPHEDDNNKAAEEGEGGEDAASPHRPAPMTLSSDSTISTQMSSTFSVDTSGTTTSTPGTPLSTPPASTDVDPFDQPTKLPEREDDSQPAKKPEEEQPAKAPVPETLVSADVRSAFSRAATLIKEAMGMDGLTFLDACPTGFASRSRNPTPQERGDPFLSDSTDDGEDETAAAESATLGCSLRVKLCSPKCSNEQNEHPVRVSETLLQRVIRKYPRGTVFSADQDGFIDERTAPRTDTNEDDFGKPKHRRTRSNLDVAELFRSIPGARSIIFLPLWHFQSETWFAATIGWTTDPTKAFEKCDLIYLSAFGNSIMAEVSRFEALAVSRSKSDFISSVSHELRSPLHGILASAELLRDTLKDPSQLHMLDMIESCGSTLLDTMNHILDFAKINNHLTTSTPQGKESKEAVASLPANGPLLTEVDLGTLVQDVVEAVYIGQNSRPTFKNRGAFIDASASPASEIITTLEGQELPVLVTVKVQHDAPWLMDIEVGAWKRIVMNLFGNALKYTRSGHVQVSLHVMPHADKSGTKRDTICFCVNDTGIGMSPDYLKYRLFTPFAQENNLSTGTGLGLSIVKQIVNDLGGTLDVQSQIGVGTRVRVFVPLPESASRGPPTPLPGLPAPVDTFDPLKKLKGKAIYAIDPSNQAPRAELSIELRNAKHERARTVKSTLDEIAPTWFDMKVVLAGDDVDADADFYFVDFSVIDALSERQLNIIMKSPKWKPLIILCYGPPSNRTRSNLEQRNVVFLRHPIGPKKLAAALLGGLDGISKNPVAPPPQPLKTESDKLSVRATPPPESTSMGSRSMHPGSLKVPAPFRPDMPAMPRQHLLLVDDNEINLKILTTLVKKLGCTFEAATNGLEAVQRFKASARPFDFIFMDITMPVMNGFAATSEIRSFERAMHMPPTKVIALTGLGSAGSQQEAFASGADLFLTKPVSMKALRGLLAGDDGGVVPGGVGSPSGLGSATGGMGGFFENVATVTGAGPPGGELKVGGAVA